jgi:hypothetical protein
LTKKLMMGAAEAKQEARELMMIHAPMLLSVWSGVKSSELFVAN